MPARTVILVGCVGGKVAHPARAEDLYVTPLFLKRRAYAEAEIAAGRADEWYVLSALYGLVRPSAVLDPYDKRLNRRDVDAFAGLLRDQIEFAAGTILEVHAGAPYVEAVRRACGLRVEAPLEGRGIGKQLAWYTRSEPGWGSPLGRSSRDAERRRSHRSMLSRGPYLRGCPRCKAAPRTACRTPEGETRPAHMERVAR